MDVLYSQVLNTNDEGGFNGYTAVMRIPASVMSLPTYSIAVMRFTFQAGDAEGLIITNAYVGHKAGSGDAYDFASTPVQITFSGGSSGVTIPALNSSISDTISFQYDKTTDMLIAMYFNGGTGNDTVRRKTGLSATIVKYEGAALNEAGTVNKTTGYTTATGELIAINSIECDKSPGGVWVVF